MVLHGNRLEDLRDVLTAWLARAPLQPLENELMLVQSNGIAQWLKLALARSTTEAGLGISAAIDVQLPGRFLWSVYRAVLGLDAVAATSPFDKSRLAWRLLRLIPQHLDEPAYAPLRDFLQPDIASRDEPLVDWLKRFQLASQIADLFDQYQVYRADWLDDWQHGNDVLRDDLRNRATPIDASQQWQPRLWRQLLADIGAGDRRHHRAGVHRDFIARLAELTERPQGLPRRLVVFGISSLPQQTLEALTAMARFSQVLLVVANPCRHYWADIIEDRELLRADRRRQTDKPGVPALPRYEDLHLHANPLLAAWGKQGRDYIRLLDSFDQPDRYRPRFAAVGQSIDLFQDVEGDRLLQQVQQAVLDLQPLPPAPAQSRSWQPDDHSLRFHVTHNPQREVEVLHDQLLAMFEQAARDGRPLVPRDVIVMVPDIQTYAPHVQAVFGRLASDDPRHLPYSVADQSASRSAPVVMALAQLLGLPESRFAVSDILDLLDVPALRQRFNLAEEDLSTLRRWIEGAGVRWGLDGKQKDSLGLPALEQNSWRFGLRRMLLGYAVGDGESLDGIAPYAEIGGLDAALLGPLSALLDTLERYWRLLRAAATPTAWVERLHRLLDDFFDARQSGQDSEDAAQLHRLHDALDAWQEACEEASFETAIPLSVVREQWLQAIDQSRLSQRFMGGAISFGTLLPMRAIPFRVVCLLGMNDGDYPRRQTSVDFDLMARVGHHRPGDRSRREDDRYLFLEALLSARDALHISWVGRSARDNSSLPPSVLVGQLRDYLAAGWHRHADAADSPDAGEHLLAALTTEYPLQPFSRRYFESAHDPHLFTYAREWQEAHRGDIEQADAADLPPWVPETALGLGQLQRFLARPVAYFFNQRLKVYFTETSDDALDEEPFTLDALQRHVAVRDVLQAALDDPGGATPRTRMANAVRRLEEEGRLPAGGIGAALQDDIAAEVASLAEQWQRACERWRPLDEKLELHYACGELTVEDWLTDLRHDGQNQRRRLELVGGNLLDKAGTLRLDKLIPAWVVHLLANANGLGMQTQVIAVDAQPIFAALSRDDAAPLMDSLLAALYQGMNSPLPIARRSAFAWLTADEGGRDPVKAAALCYEGGYGPATGEVFQDACLARAWPDFAQLQQAGFEGWLSLYRPLTTALLHVEDVA